MRALVSTSTYDFPAPSEYTGTSSTFVDSARNAQGVVVGAVIREDVAKIELKWKFLTVEQWSNILKQFNSKYGGDFYRDITFFNETSGSWETREFYVGDRKAGIFRRNPTTGSIVGYLNVSLSLVEV